MKGTYRIGFGWLGKLATVTVLGVAFAGALAIAEAQPVAAVTAGSVVDVVRLDPIVVTIGAERFDAVRAAR